MPELAIKLICICIVCYFIGNINFAIIISRILKGDIRERGSGNPGTMNMIRTFGPVPGIICLILDILKSFVPALFAWAIVADGFFVYTNLLGAYVGGLSVIIGHIFPVVYKFKGGKGVASIIGLSFLLTPVETAVAFIIAFCIVAFVHIGFIASFVAIFIPSIAQVVWISINFSVSEYAIAEYIIIFIMLAFCVFEHRGNIARLIHGKENKTYIFGKKEKKPE